ncbi:hypothetical protein QQZ08_001952 [Neonectria magnoliae]|uniref:UBC core domain-containing protein n=1 Tax=Neonectria magnoliae TaxID=2732573 RepID=A0ABR1IFC5_9HYPO
MASLKMGTLPSLRRQQLLSEFAGLKQACPEGMFVSLTPGDPTLWSGVLFVRNGPYAPAVLRFQISFPDSYPQLPPLVTFSSDMFHPLLTPSTTYTYTTDIQDSGTVSASDQERLPPGGFSLRHGFPDWFGRGRRSIEAARQSARQQSASPAPTQGTASNLTTPASRASPGGDVPLYMQTSRKGTSAYEVLRYIRSTFDDEAVLDSVPLAAAGNPGAWHAWRTHRRTMGKLSDDAALAEDSQTQDEENLESSESASNSDKRTQAATATRHPGEWNWDGVWEDRVKTAVNTSLSESILYGAATTSDDMKWETMT